MAQKPARATRSVAIRRGGTEDSLRHISRPAANTTHKARLESEPKQNAMKSK